ncbi:hypothetical protein GGF46_002520 [Coemansia sp. RSA 552]|nr:hypothetical protein GGF46_002520 [Coemansia sp. RSA 552]
MGSAKLPSKVVRRILLYLTDEAPRSLAHWTAQLPLLAVCRQWRNVGVPLVYRRVFIACSASKAPKERADGDSTLAKYQTNIELVLMMKQYHVVDCLNLRMDYQPGLVSFISKVQELLRIVRPVWSNISELHAELKSGAGPNPPTDAALALAQGFQTLLPEISRLHVNAAVEDTLCSEFATGLVSAYAPQLTQCNCFVKVRPYARFSKRLDSAVLRLEEGEVGSLEEGEQGLEEGGQLMEKNGQRLEEGGQRLEKGGHRLEKGRQRIQAHSLSRLYIADNLRSTLKLFHTGDTVEFTKLQELCVLSAGGPDSPTDNSIYHPLVFPHLSLLRLTPSVQVSRMLVHAQFPERLDKLEILTRAGTITLFNVRFTEEVREQLADYADDTAGFWAMASFLFGPDQLAEHAHLTLGRLRDVPEPESLGWQALTRLEILPGIAAGYLLRLIPRLSALCELVVHNLALDSSQAEDASQGVRYASWPLDKPFNSALLVLRLNYNITKRNQRSIMELMERLLPELPAIEEIFLPEFPQEFFAFVAANANHPHIAGFVQEAA